MKLLGLGRDQLLKIPESDMRLDPAALATMLEDLHARRQPILATIGVLGTTEFGTIDPVHEIIALRERFSEAGFGFGVHVDAAWGGYLATLMRNPDGSLRALSELHRQFESFPTSSSHAAVGALAHCDSITVDPHKLGFVPYGAGAFICRDQRAMGLLSEEADYVFHNDREDDYFARYRKLGRYILEGSKSGAAAAAVYVTHKVLPLDHAHFGRIVAETIRSTEVFFAHAQRFANAMTGIAQVCIPFTPDSNLVCLAINPCGNPDVAVMNAFIHELYETLHCAPGGMVQSHEFYGSMTTLRAEVMGAADMARVLQELKLDPATLQADEDGADRLFILRHTLMNPFLVDTENGIDYIERYFEYLGRRTRALVEPQRAG